MNWFVTYQNVIQQWFHYCGYFPSIICKLKMLHNIPVSTDRGKNANVNGFHKCPSDYWCFVLIFIPEGTGICALKETKYLFKYFKWAWSPRKTTDKMSKKYNSIWTCNTVVMEGCMHPTCYGFSVRQTSSYLSLVGS